MDLLEREPFLDALDEHATSAAAGNGRMVLVGGAPGIGKTALLESFRTRRAGARWLWGACDASFTPRPLGPLHDIAQQAGGRLADVLRSDADRNTVFAESLTALGDGGEPTIVVVEDLHWADEATLDWLSYVARRIARCHALLVVTYRPGDAAADPVLATAVGAFTGHGSTRRMSLPPLTPAAVSSLAGDHGLDGDHVYRVSAGNPFFVVEIVADPAATVPSSVADVVRARVLRHSPPGRRMLAAASVLARPAPAPLLAALAGVETSVIDECVASGALVPTADGYGFAHELTRLAVEQELPSYQATELHRAALTLLRRVGADRARLAHHAELAGDTAATLEHARGAGDDAARLHSHREAIAQYERALRAVDGGGGTADTRADLLDDLAQMHAMVDHWEEAARCNEEAVAVRRGLGDPVRLSRTLRQRHVCMWRLCRPRESTAAADEAWALMADQPASSERTWAMGLHARAHLDEPASAGDLATAIATAEQGDDAELLAWLLQASAIRKVAHGEDGLPDFRRAHEVAIAGGCDEQAARALVNLYEVSVDQLLLDETEWVWEDGRRWCEEHEMHTYAHCLSAIRSQSLVRRGRLEEAERLAGGTLERPMSAVNRAHLNIPYLTSRVRRGEDGVHGELLDARRLAVESGDPCWLLPVETAFCELAWLSGDPSLVDAHVLETYAATSGTEPWLRAALAAGLARLGLLTDPPAGAPAPYRHEIDGDHCAAAAVWRERGCPYDAAVALASTGDPALLEEALTAFLTLDAGPAARRVRHMLRELGVRTVPRGPRRTTRAHPAGLTPREAEVLAHLADGLTNAQIAQRLVLSPRTVDHHVSAVLGKLGVATRAEAARRAAGTATAPTS